MTPMPVAKRLRRFAREPLPDSAARQSATVTTDRSANIGDAPASTKKAVVLGLLMREEGASIKEIVAATGWLPHTTRAALSGLRKKGQAITRDKIDDATRYRIMPAVFE
ncbi:DUF3489 domain-containing protein [Novosphingobium sp.]|uniref:DUF3489 domain-containing protein n=1 Tax=Novosphingobium sp. TaxID=1874826 RepID=UPI003D0F365B